MKNVIIIVASVFILTRPLWPVVEYVINYNYIIEKLCENRDKPEMKCNGKCYLAKQFAKQASEEDRNPFKGKTSKIEIPQFIISENIEEFTFASEQEMSSKTKINYVPNLNTSLFTSKILHPPRV
ncbi:hypothetical protein KXJ69_11165 [Aureisphaera sp. CAU 1614]|uniref:Uncharacterized protein n=1 Tax=Halomarinibacterium sedimenti TaxID=2857106 RepID=A0A9X1FQI3_9FLAO|nr:hypothetical protein [Halomarinibacterium sedimenti]MBW2938670.1 hypothetical protein [Halomarinibacterium sedimenti]